MHFSLSTKTVIRIDSCEFCSRHGDFASVISSICWTHLHPWLAVYYARVVILVTLCCSPRSCVLLPCWSFLSRFFKICPACRRAWAGASLAAAVHNGYNNCVGNYWQCNHNIGGHYIYFGKFNETITFNFLNNWVICVRL